MQFLRIGTSGMRGEVGNGLDAELAMNYASALGTYLDGGKIVVSTDTRISSPMLKHAVVSALLSCGCEIIDAGTVPSPLAHFLVKYFKADGGVVIGAGHHPSNWNALQPVASNGACFNSVQTQELLDIYHSGQFLNCSWDRVGKVVKVDDECFEKYLELICSVVDVNLIARAGLSVIVDYCSGSGAYLGKLLAEKLGVKLITLNDRQTGILPHTPEPRPRSAVQAQSLLEAIDADLAMVFNSDMTRSAVVTNCGETLSEEYTFPLVVDHLLSKKPGAVVVTNSCTTRTLDEVVAKHGGKVIKTRVGQSNLVDTMVARQAICAGDGSGSFALSETLPCFDGFLTMALLLEAMAKNECSSSDLMKRLPRYNLVKKQVRCRSSHAYTLVRNIAANFPEAVHSEVDGQRFDWPGGWIHLRASLTEPIIRMIVEWDSRDKAEDMAVYTRGLMERLVTS